MLPVPQDLSKHHDFVKHFTDVSCYLLVVLIDVLVLPCHHATRAKNMSGQNKQPG